MRQLVALVLVWPLVAAAGPTVYRSVDENGVVSYSTRPVQGAVESKLLELPPGPTQAQRAAARARMEADRRRADEMAAVRHERAERGAAEAEAELAKLRRSGKLASPTPTREEAAEQLRRELEARQEAAAEDRERRSERRHALPREPVHIQPVPSPAPGDAGERPGPDPVRIQPVPSIGPPGSGVGPGPRGGRRGRGGG
jgi:hypothetical protein